MKTSPGRRAANNLVALSSAAVLTVYAAGYMKTRAAAERLENAGHRDTAGPPSLRAPAPDVVHPPVAGAGVRPEAESATAAPAAPNAVAPRPASSEAPVRTEPERRAAAAASVAESTPAPLAATVAFPAPAPIVPPQVPPIAPATNAAVPPVAVPVTPLAVAVPPDADPKVAEPPAPRPSPYKDGTYYGWGTSRHGSIQASVTIEGGKIVASSIAQCLTRYSCSWIAHLVPQVVSRQGANVDYVSGATQSTYAFYDAVVEALSKAK